MATTPTSLPIPSEDPRDLKFNAGKFDQFVTSDQHYYIDRFGVQRWTIAGVNYTAAEAISQYGYITLDSFEDGATLTLPNQALRFEATGEYYRWDGGFPEGGKVIPQGSTPASTGGIGLGKWVGVGDASLRADLASSTGYQLIPSMQIQFWKSIGDIRGWLAKCNGVDDDSTPVANAIADTGGNIIVPGPTLLSTCAYIRGFDSPIVEFKGKGAFIINDNFNFRAGTRGILVFHECHNPSAINATIKGARLFKATAAEPWQDGDAGVEYLVCTGRCLTKPNILSDFMTWGVIHTQCKEYEVVGGQIKNCMVQSGIGGISVEKLKISDVTIDRVGLYGVEAESRDAIDTSKISNVFVTNSQKGIMCYDSILRPSISGVTAKYCVEGISFSNNSPNNGEGGSVEACNIIDCKHAFVINNTPKVRINSNTARKFIPGVYTRTRAQDFIRKVVSGVAYVVDEVSAPANLNVGDKIMLEDGIERTVSAVNAQTIDPVFNAVRGFTTTPAMDSSHEKHAMSRYITTGETGVVMYGGAANSVTCNTFGLLNIALLSFGNHDMFNMSKNTFENVTTLLSSGQDGTLTNSSINIEPGDVSAVNRPVVADHTKFISAYTATDNFWIGKVAVGHQHIITHKTGVIGRLTCILDPSVVASGNIVLKVNGVDTITNFSGDPAVGVATFPNLVVEGSLRLQLVDTAGDISGDGFCVKFNGAYTGR